MNNVSERISLYHNLFVVCLVLALICLVLAVVLFFVLDIHSTMGYLTGRRAKKKIKELEEATAVSGRLLQKERKNMQYVAQEMKDDMGVRQKAKPGIRKVEHAVEAALPKTAEMAGTQSYSETPVEQGTEVLQTNAAEQGNAYAANGDSTGMLGTVAVTMGKFTVVRELMFVHTEEVI